MHLREKKAIEMSVLKSKSWRVTLKSICQDAGYTEVTVFDGQEFTNALDNGKSI